MDRIHHILTNTRTGRLSLWLACLALLAGCTVGPDFSPPRTDVPKAWAGPGAMPATQPAGGAQALGRWWKAFNDPLLASLVERAIESNLDLRIAQARIRQARASRGVAASGLGPSVSASGAYNRGQSGSGSPVTSHYQAGFDAGWEIDIFGGVRRGVEAADAQVQAAVEDRRNVQVTLAAETARLYVQLRSLQQRLAIARRNLELQQHSAELTRQRFEGGFVSGLDVANAQAQVATTSSQVPLLESSARQTLYAIELLLDRTPGSLAQELAAPADIPYAPPAVPLGVPADLLRRRPDIRSAEAGIHAATANIGVAVADLFPRATINASLGWQADSLSSLLNPASRFWSFGPAVTWNAFQSGRVLSNIEVQKALEEQSILAYRQTVLTAIQEVENALVASVKEQEHRKALTDAVAANRRAVELAGQLYAQGNTDFLNVLSAQQGLLNSEDALAQSTAAISTDLIALYKALGGGWEETVPPGGQK
ncbi:MAG: putative efflux pump outer membrane protein TtgC precursor [Planctomycetes bacterium ADurb.Bin126]|nr:MAG: putative efflux pump outer membrane protein TtgC precursor [Planctomycetes bacterium ADurb.Bin126]HOD84328.1 efflux transporter outer membrane subunit [Phycisphaerae bacterium]HQL73461.1 efflux transporter outer membrane subunit [Phycisphaerae bacterium]